MSEQLLTPATYNGGMGDLGAAGYGYNAIGTNQSVNVNGGGIVANPGNYSAGCLSITGGKRRRKKRGGTKRGGTKRGGTKRGGTKRGGTKRGGTKRGGTKRGRTKKTRKI